MPQITVELSDGLYARLCHEADRRQISLDELAREALNVQLRRRRLAAAAAGSSGRDDVSERVEELLRAES